MSFYGSKKLNCQWGVEEHTSRASGVGVLGWRVEEF